MKIGLLISLPRESKYFFEKIKFEEIIKSNRIFYLGNLDDKDIILLHTHCGPANASSATESIILNFNPDMIINVGSAGGHNESLLPGDVVIGTSYKIIFNPFEFSDALEHAKVPNLIRFYKIKEDIKYESLVIPENLNSNVNELIPSIELDPIFSKKEWKSPVPYRKPYIQKGVVGSNEAWTTETKLIQKKIEVFKHDAEDKESAYIAQICKLHEKTFVSFKGISDNELVFDLKNNKEIDTAIEHAARNAAVVTIEFINNLKPILLD
jgi:adenosylhomocysteine nucleosidase